MNKQKLWLNKFNPDWDYVCNKPLVSIAGIKFVAGDKIDKNLLTTRRLELLYDNRKVIPFFGESVEVETPVSEPETQEIVEPQKEEDSLEPEIIGPVTGGWFKVMFNGEQIGQSTRDKAQAEETLLNWMLENGE